VSCRRPPQPHVQQQAGVDPYLVAVAGGDSLQVLKIAQGVAPLLLGQVLGVLMGKQFPQWDQLAAARARVKEIGERLSAMASPSQDDAAGQAVLTASTTTNGSRPSEEHRSGPLRVGSPRRTGVPGTRATSRFRPSHVEQDSLIPAGGRTRGAAGRPP
jgi:hypothetical protein